MTYYSKFLASTYGSGSYDTSVYNGATSTSSGGTTTPAGSSSGGSVLANTGFDVLLAVTLACVVIFAALVVRFVRRKSTPAIETIEFEDNQA